MGIMLINLVISDVRDCAPSALPALTSGPIEVHTPQGFTEVSQLCIVEAWLINLQ